MIGKQVVSFDDGLFEVTLIKTPKNPLRLQEIVASLLIEQVDTNICTLQDRAHYFLNPV